MLPGHVGPEAAVAPQHLVEPVRGLGGGEAAAVRAEALPVPPQGHPRSEVPGDLVPLRGNGASTGNEAASAAP